MPTRAEMTTELTTNCDCWRGKAKTLNALDDATLAGVYAAEAKAAERDAVFNALAGKVGLDPDTTELTGEAAVELIANAELTRDDEAPAPKPGKTKTPAPTGNAAGAERTEPMTDDEWLAANHAPPAVRAAIEYGRRAEAEKRDRLLGRLVGNAAPKAVKPLRLVYEKLTTADLELAANALPPAAGNEILDAGPRALYGPSRLTLPDGTGGGRTDNASGDDDSGPLVPLAMNFDDEPAGGRKPRRGRDDD